MSEEVRVAIVKQLEKERKKSINTATFFIKTPIKLTALFTGTSRSLDVEVEYV